MESNINEYLSNKFGEVYYVTRTAGGNYTIQFKERGHMIYSSCPLPDSDVALLTKKGIRVFDFLKCDDFLSLLREMEKTDAAMFKPYSQE